MIPIYTDGDGIIVPDTKLQTSSENRTPDFPTQRGHLPIIYANLSLKTTPTVAEQVSPPSRVEIILCQCVLMARQAIKLPQQMCTTAGPNSFMITLSGQADGCRVISRS